MPAYKFAGLRLMEFCVQRAKRNRESTLDDTNNVNADGNSGTRHRRAVSRRFVLKGVSAATVAGVTTLSQANTLAQRAQDREKSPIVAAARQETAPRDPRVEALLKKMTLAEKVGQLNVPLVLPKMLLGQNSTSPVGSLKDQERFVKGEWVDYLGPGGGFFSLMNETVSGLIPIAKVRKPAEQAELSNHLQRLARKTRLGIPLLLIGEGTHGSVAPGATIFPEGPALATSWNMPLVGAVYAAAAKEARAVGIHALNTILAEIVCDPRFGRGCEGFGEDPYLIAAMIRSLVRAMQGSDLASPDKVIASLCHYPGQTPNTGGLEGSPVALGAREFRQIHLRPWKAGFAEAGALMTEASSPTMDGIAAHGSEYLLTDLLRGELRFRGVVISEGGGFGSLVSEHIAATQKEAGALSIRAGVDIGITWESAYLDDLIKSVKDGTVPIELVDRAVRRVLALKFKLGLFDNPFVDPKRAAQVVNCKEHREVALQAAREAIVLLKNDKSLLPLGTKFKRIAVIGPNADEPDNLLGDYCANPAQHPVPSILSAIRSTAPSDVSISYARGCGILGDDRSGFAEAVRAARRAQVAVVVVGEQTKGGFLGVGTTNGEARDIASLDLTGPQQALIEAVHATGVPTVVVLINGRPLSIRWVARHVPAILEAWLPGERGGEAVAEVLFGKINPSGRLPITIPRHVGQLPVYYYQKHARANAAAYVDMPASPLYEFGFGLSYTEFRYSNLRISPIQIRSNGAVEVLVDVSNVGSREGQEVVQLYVMDVVSSVSLPAKQLRGFSKIALAAGETKTVKMMLKYSDLALVNAKYETVVEPGEFEVMVGSSSARIHLRKRFTVVEG